MNREIASTKDANQSRAHPYQNISELSGSSVAMQPGWRFGKSLRVAARMALREARASSGKFGLAALLMTVAAATAFGLRSITAGITGHAFENARSIPDVSIDFCSHSIDAKNVPVELAGFRTMFSAFHHFPPAEARAIIQNTVDARQGIGIFEITRRTAPAIAAMFLWSLSSLLITPFVRPFRWSRLIFTYLVPVIPFVLLFDGIVSCLRTYRPSELTELVGKLSAAGYEWKTGECRDSRFNAPITYLIGFPCAS